MSTTFEPGSPPDAGRIPLCVPELAGRELDYLRECVETNWVSSAGPFVSRFESMVAQQVGRRFGIATASGTAALHVALLISGVEPEDEVIVPTLTFIAPANAVRYCGAWPHFIDVEPRYWQLDTQRVAEFLEAGCERRAGGVYDRATGRRVRALLPVHILGHPVEMDPLLELARDYELAVIEDATESLGARYRGRPVGSFGGVACFSFNGNKLVTTGAGGMLVTDDPALAARARYLTTQAKDDPVEYIHGAVGYNYRLSNIQAALGCAQMERLDQLISAKLGIAAKYAAAFRGLPGITPMQEAPWASSVFWLYTILLDESARGLGRLELAQELEVAGIQTRPLWQPLHLSPVFRSYALGSGVVAERLNRGALSLPSSAGLSEVDQERVIDAVRGAIESRASRGGRSSMDE